MIDENIKLSIIVPVYNVELYLKQSIESILNQSYTNLEIILVDDGSTDSSGIICDEYAKIDKRIIVVHKKNGGAVSARKQGIDIATGEYVIQVDADDWIDVDRFQTLVRDGLFDKPDIVCNGGYYLEYLNHRRFKDIPDELIGLFETKEIWNNQEKFLVQTGYYERRNLQLMLWCCCYKREIYQINQLMLDDDIARGQDLIVSLACILAAKNIRCISNPTYHYRQNREGAISSRRTNYPKGSARLYYKNMIKYLDYYAIDNELWRNGFARCIYKVLMLTNYKNLYDYYSDFLFPFSQITNYKKIIVYGAGNFGVEVVNAIIADNRFEIVAWVDKNKKSNLRGMREIDDINKINKMQYDYVIVAVMNLDTAQEIKQDLKEIVDNSKIILMTSDAMDINSLENIYQ